MTFSAGSLVPQPASVFVFRATKRMAESPAGLPVPQLPVVLERDPKAAIYHTGFLRPLFQRLSTEEAFALLPEDDLPFLNGVVSKYWIPLNREDKRARSARVGTFHNRCRRATLTRCAWG